MDQAHRRKMQQQASKDLREDFMKKLQGNVGGKEKKPTSKSKRTYGRDGYGKR